MSDSTINGNNTLSGNAQQQIGDQNKQSVIVNINQPSQELQKAPANSSSTPQGLLIGENDRRLDPPPYLSAGQILGREKEIGTVVEFLQSPQNARVVSAHVVGVGGIGKTEVCKAALRQWLTQNPSEVVYYVEVPDSANANQLLYALGVAIGFSEVDSWHRLFDRLPQGLFYLDNLEGLANTPEGQEALRNLLKRNGVRWLMSSRVGLNEIFGKPINLDRLEKAPAIALFRELWNGQQPLPPDGELESLISSHQGLDGHPLCIRLCAQLGECYSYADLEKKWIENALALARNAMARDRHAGLEAALILTSTALSSSEANLKLWLVAALFNHGLSDNLLSEFENKYTANRTILIKHRLLEWRGDNWQMLSPIARYAMDSAIFDKNGFKWRPVAQVLKTWLMTKTSFAKRVDSADIVLANRFELVAQFPMIIALIMGELKRQNSKDDWINKIQNELNNTLIIVPPLIQQDYFEILKQSHCLTAVSNSRYGDLAQRLGNIDEAQSLYQNALALYKKERDELGQANTLRRQGELAQRLGNIDEAQSLYQNALALYKKERAELGQAHTLLRQGELAQRLGNIDEAQSLYQNALALYKKERAELGQANTLHSQGELAQRLGNIDEAQSLYQNALALYKKERDELGQANTLSLQGELAQRLGNIDEAQSLYQNAMALYKKEREEFGQAIIDVELGNIAKDAQNFEVSEINYCLALPLFQKEKSRSGEAYLRQHWGDVHRFCHRHQAAMEDYLYAIKTFLDIKEPEQLGYCFAKLAKIYHLQGNTGIENLLIYAWVYAKRSHGKWVMEYVQRAIVKLIGDPNDWLKQSQIEATPANYKIPEILHN